MHSETLKIKLTHLPHNPGIYQFYDEKNTLLYIGKAKDLKKRVSSYFNKDNYSDGKTQVLVKKIHDIRVTVVDTELDALLLENALIKKHQPRYNVQLKDGKTYSLICIKNERFPRIFPTRKIINDGSEYFGPYASGKLMHTMLELIAKLYPLRNCNLNLSKENIEGNKFKVCLEYQIGNCKGPCEGLQSQEDYDQSINHIKAILKGNVKWLIQHIKSLMNEAARKYEFEKAHILKEKLLLIEKHQSKSVIVNPKINNVDVFTIAHQSNYSFVNFLKVANGSIVQAHTLELKKKVEERPEDILLLAITDIRKKFNSVSNTILVPFKLDFHIGEVNFVIPKRGDKLKLIKLSEKNAQYYIHERLQYISSLNPEQKRTQLLHQMKEDLRVTEVPWHIECFDNSNLQGGDAVAAMAVFKNSKPFKSDYRIFNIKTVKGPDDFASMEEVIYRRYKRLLDESQPLPQLIIIDGGKGQLSSALNSLKKLGLNNKISIIAIAKRLEEIYYPDDTLPMYLDKKSSTLRIIQQLRNEAHRFGIKHHRNKRIKSSLKTELINIKGIGKSTAEELIKVFKSVKKIKETSEASLSLIIGQHKASLVTMHFRNTSNEDETHTASLIEEVK